MHAGLACGSAVFPMTSTKRLNLTGSRLLILKEWESEFFEEALHIFDC